MTHNTEGIRILSLGWGVQSWTIAAMIAMDELPPVDFMVSADTTWEHQATYEFARQWTPWLGEHGQSVVTVQSKRADAIQKWNGATESIMAPAFTLTPEGDRGQLSRQCTKTWKIDPIRKVLTTHLKSRGMRKTPGIATVIIGISLDEWARMKDSDVKYIKHEYPLVDRRISRRMCAEWLEAHDLPLPRKSSCVFCPYKSKASWIDLGRQKGKDLATAIKVDEAVRDKRPGYQIYVHPSRRPLDEAVEDDGQLTLWPETECDSGYCFT